MPWQPPKYWNKCLIFANILSGKVSHVPCNYLSDIKLLTQLGDCLIITTKTQNIVLSFIMGNASLPKVPQPRFRARKLHGLLLLK